MTWPPHTHTPEWGHGWFSGDTGVIEVRWWLSQIPLLPLSRAALWTPFDFFSIFFYQNSMVFFVIYPFCSVFVCLFKRALGRKWLCMYQPVSNQLYVTRLCKTTYHLKHRSCSANVLALCLGVNDKFCRVLFFCHLRIPLWHACIVWKGGRACEIIYGLSHTLPTPWECPPPDESSSLSKKLNFN